MRHLIKLYEDFRRAVELSQRSGKKGFSLIELLVVIAIIAILAAIAIPQYNKYRANAMLSNVQSLTKDLTNLALGVAQTSAQNPVKECRYADIYYVYTVNGTTGTTASECTDSDNKCYAISIGNYNGQNSTDACDKVAIWDQDNNIKRPDWVKEVKMNLTIKNLGSAVKVENGYIYVLSHFSIGNKKLGCKYYPANDTMADYDTTYVCKTF